MTDVARHLDSILKVVHNLVGAAKASGQLDWSGLRSAVRTVLPRSYGLGAGCVVGPAGSSEPVPLLLYDVPLAGGAYPDSAAAYRIEHTLLVLDVALSHDEASFRSSLGRIASVKRLATFRGREPLQGPSRPPGQNRRTIPRDRLPFALVCCDRFGDDAILNERVVTPLHRILGNHPMGLRPDQIEVFGQGGRFLNPLLEREESGWYDVGWSLTPDLVKPQICYVCKQKYFRRHFFYEQLCQECGDLNHQKRTQSADLDGYRILITGGRIKIGYAVGLRLLRAGAEVIVTTRFPHDAARRYCAEPDYGEWQDRLHIYGLDLRNVPGVAAFVSHLYDVYPHLDALVNNAAQTVKRPASFYAHLLPFEATPVGELPPPVRLLVEPHAPGESDARPALAAPLTAGLESLLPAQRVDRYGQPIDDRDFNSWVMHLEDVPIVEMVEVQLINSVAPAILTGQLRGLLARSAHERRFVVNVAAAEGRFAQFKSGHHPHTNMAKAALNMLTRTVAYDYAEDGIYVNSVDPGWVSDQAPRTSDESRELGDARIPVDLTDAAARVCDPIFVAVRSGQVSVGQLFKDYACV